MKTIKTKVCTVGIFKEEEFTQEAKKGLPPHSTIVGKLKDLKDLEISELGFHDIKVGQYGIPSRQFFKNILRQMGDIMWEDHIDNCIIVKLL